MSRPTMPRGEPRWGVTSSSSDDFGQLRAGGVAVSDVRVEAVDDDADAVGRDNLVDAVILHAGRDDHCGSYCGVDDGEAQLTLVDFESRRVPLREGGKVARFAVFQAIHPGAVEE